MKLLVPRLRGKKGFCSGRLADIKFQRSSFHPPTKAYKSGGELSGILQQLQAPKHDVKHIEQRNPLHSYAVAAMVMHAAVRSIGIHVFSCVNCVNGITAGMMALKRRFRNTLLSLYVSRLRLLCGTLGFHALLVPCRRSLRCTCLPFKSS